MSVQTYDKKIQHLQMIEKIIERLANNSFHIKKWTVTFVSGIIALAVQSSKIVLLNIKIPLLFFCALDTYYLYLERRYRHLYCTVVKKDENDIDFSMVIDVNKDEECWLMQKLTNLFAYIRAFFSCSIWPLYLGLWVGSCIINQYFKN